MPSLDLFRHGDLDLLGVTSRPRANALTAGRLVRVRPGVFVRGGDWERAKPETRVVTRARALAMTSSNRPVFSHETAAAIHGLPLYRANPTRVHVIAPASRPGRVADVIRHRGELGDDVMEREGMLVTTLERTVADMARTATFEQAVTVADAAVRQRFVSGPGAYDPHGATAFGEQVLAITRRSPHGQSRAARVIAFADGRAQLPGESISRVRLAQLGFRDVQLQVAVAAPGDGWYYVDFGLEDVPAFGEFDGSMKYIDGRLLDGRSASGVLDDEKQREDWIRGTTQRSYARWGWPHTATPAALEARLAAFGIRPPQ